jgi:2-hydroxycarboxylate transporter family
VELRVVPLLGGQHHEPGLEGPGQRRGIPVLGPFDADPDQGEGGVTPPPPATSAGSSGPTVAPPSRGPTGRFVGRSVNLYPVEAAIVNAYHSGQGGTGDVAVLTAANRMQLMPFAQIATPIGGAITVTLTLLALRDLS